jgi:hypothetical protein
MNADRAHQNRCEDETGDSQANPDSHDGGGLLLPLLIMRSRCKANALRLWSGQPRSLVGLISFPRKAKAEVDGAYPPDMARGPACCADFYLGRYRIGLVLNGSKTSYP